MRHLSRCHSAVFASRVLWMLLVVLGIVQNLKAEEPDEITAAKVNQAIERAVQHLKRTQLPDGQWPDRAVYQGGLTPLCTLALLHAGCAQDEAAVARAVASQDDFVPTNTYAISLQTLVFCRLDPVKYRLKIARNVAFLQERQVPDGEFRGMWSRPSAGSKDHIDNSMTHFAMLALYEAERTGVTVNPQTWKVALEYWERSQNPDGSWGWGPKHPGSGSMTCAGIAAIIIASGQLSTGDASIENEQIQCCGEQTQRPSLERAIRWLERNFSITRNPGWEFWHSYYLYSLERAGRLTGRRFFGQHDWYREGAAFLVKTQARSGSWSADDDFELDHDDIVSTAFSLMFLAKARRPIVIAHLQHRPAGDWNRHRSALYNLVSHVETLWKRELTHQEIDISTATVEDLLESPVLFLQGKESPEFTSTEQQKLRQYLERGGFIFAEQCCGGTFDAGFRQLVKDLFPEPEAVLHQLPADHLVWYAEKPVRSRTRHELWGVDYGCRTCIIYSQLDLSCFWELARTGREHELPVNALLLINDARTIGANVLAYATNREVPFRNPAVIPAAPPRVDTPSQRQLQLATVIHLGGCDAAPGALRYLLRVADEDFGIPCNRTPRAIRLTDAALFNHPILIFSGRLDFRLTELERKQLRLYLERGGQIFADSIGSSPQFAKAFRRETKLIFPGRELTKIPLTHPLCSDVLGGTDISMVQRKAVLESISPAGAANPPVGESGGLVLEGLLLNDRYCVIFSPYDISCTLDSHILPPFEGYQKADATRIAMNVLYYFLVL